MIGFSAERGKDLICLCDISIRLLSTSSLISETRTQNPFSPSMARLTYDESMDFQKML